MKLIVNQTKEEIYTCVWYNYTYWWTNIENFRKIIKS